MKKTRLIIGACWTLTIAFCVLVLVLPDPSPKYFLAPVLLVFWPCRFWIPFASRALKYAFFGGLLVGVLVIISLSFIPLTSGPGAAHHLLLLVMLSGATLMLVALAWSDVVTFRRA